MDIGLELRTLMILISSGRSTLLSFCVFSFCVPNSKAKKLLLLGVPLELEQPELVGHLVSGAHK